MQRTLSYDDIELLTSTAQRSKSNDFYQLKALDKEWTRSWNTLTSDTDRTTSRPVRSDNTTWQTPRSLPIWALIDVAQDNHHWTERNSPKHILNFVNRTSPPHESLQNGEFRLLRIDDGKGDDVLRCKISNTPLHESDGKYLALSYCWGPSTQLQKVIFLNGRATLVGESLFSCLSNFRQVSDLTSACHWIDALCIRQDDVQEKNSQIPLMGRIYSAARSVNIWLGAEENDSGYVLDTMYGSEIDALTDMKFIRGFTHLLWRPWFGRLWVVQELVLASREHPPLIWSGCHSSTWQALSHLFRQFDHGLSGSVMRAVKRVNSVSGNSFLPREDRAAWTGATMRLVRTIRDSPISFLIRQRTMGTLDQFLDGAKATGLPFRATSSMPTRDLDAQPLVRRLRESTFLMSLWGLARCFKASDPRDYIFGVLGMANGLMYTDLIIDYNKSFREVYLDATVIILNGGSAVALHECLYAFPTLGTNFRLGSHQIGPSWVFDFSHKGAVWADSLQSEGGRVLQDPCAPDSTVRENAFQVHLPSCQLVVRASTVDNIAYIEDFPRIRLSERDIQDPARHDLEVQDFFEFLLVAHSIYKRGQDVNEKWGQRSLFESILEMPQATRRKTPLSAPLNSPDFDRLLNEAQNLGASPNRSALCSLYEAMEPFSSELRLALEIDSEFPVSFFVTVQGLCGLCMPGAQIGDQVVILIHDVPGWIEVPFVVRSNGDETHSMISVAWVPKSWEDLCRYNGTLEPRWMTFA